MADIAAFPTLKNILYSGNNTFTLTATTAVKAGQVVAGNDTGVSMAVDMAVGAAGSRSIGVALFDAAAGAEVTVAGPGCIVYIVNADDAATIDAWSYLEPSTNAVGGTVAAVAVAAIAGAVGTNHLDVIGIALEDNVGTATGTASKMLIAPITVVQLNNA